MKRLLSLLLLVALFGGGWWIANNPASLQPTFLATQKLLYPPCRQPITYRLDAIDPRFHLTPEQMIAALKKAELIWETPTEKDLFAYAPEGDVAVSLVYDYRQENADKLTSLGIVLEDTRESYDALHAKYITLRSEYETRKRAFDSLHEQFQEKNTRYEADLDRWNMGGRTSERDYNQLMQKQRELQNLITAINTAQKSLNATVDLYNATVIALNKIGAHINTAATEYNTIGKTYGEEFDEGLYESDASGARITIYEFQNQTDLVRVLAHELGHALGLDHTDDPSDIMYRLNESNNEKLTPNDRAAVQSLCQ